MSYNSVLKFKNYFIDEIVFKKNKDFVSNSIALDFSLEANREINDDELYCELVINIFQDKDDSPFNLQIKMVGIFDVSDVDLESPKGQDIATKSTIAILFPYLRSAVSKIVSEANLPPLILPAINVVDYIEKNKAE